MRSVEMTNHPRSTSRSGRRRRALGVLGLSALVTIGLTACGGSSASATKATTGSPQVSGVQVMRTAYTHTVGEKTAKFKFIATVHAASTTGATEAQTVTGAGEANLASRDVEVTTNAPSGGAVETLQIGSVAYSRVPPAQRLQVPGHKPWVKVNINQVDEAKLGKSYSQLSSADNDNPSRVLSYLSQVSDRVVKLGPATIDGVKTTEYKAEVDLNKVAARTKAKAGAKAGQAVQQQVQTLGTGTIPADVWIGPGNLLRRATLQVPIPAASTGASNGKGSVTLTMDFVAYGMPVHLTAPPSAQVANITSQVVQQAKAASS